MDTFMSALGDELRAARKRRHWARLDLLSRAPFDACTQTIATWELGTRSISAERLYQFCTTVGERVEDLLARVRQRIEAPSDAELCLDIAATADTTCARLALIRAWAHCQLRAQPDASTVVVLGRPALDSLAQLCELSTPGLADRLTRAGLVARPDAERGGGGAEPETAANSRRTAASVTTMTAPTVGRGARTKRRRT